MDNQLQKTYLGKDIVFTPDGWINATQTIKALGEKRLDGFINSKYFNEYLNAYCNFYDVSREDVVKVVVGGNVKNIASRNYVSDQGTYIHPDFVVLFARWINPKFAVWCDAIIKQILAGRVEIRHKGLQQEMQKDFEKLEEKYDKLFEELRLYQRPDENKDTPEL
ncbi:KilA-N domain-containing protein [Microscilla marina]|uniref:KilA-N domain family n=1 Tax=Microscilla marina ATCC 23134 TaxID=313606 RepID=A1ZQT8_MICM2|nr:KilA-N domain-containing protein [Microscilla marina]EAY27243.1 KilA-N domain family [Microscilla marina ATCC 23134]